MEKKILTFDIYDQESECCSSMNHHFCKTSVPQALSHRKSLTGSLVYCKRKSSIASIRLYKSLENLHQEVISKSSPCALRKVKSLCSVLYSEDYTLRLMPSGNFDSQNFNSIPYCCKEEKENNFKERHLFCSTLILKDMKVQVSPYTSMSFLDRKHFNEIKYFTQGNQKDIKNTFMQQSMNNFNILPLTAEAITTAPLSPNFPLYSIQTFDNSKQQIMKVNNYLTVTLNDRMCKFLGNSQFYLKNILLEDINSSTLPYSNAKEMRNSYFFSDVYAYKPIEIEVTFSSKSTSSVDIRVRRKPNYNHSFYTSFQSRKLCYFASPFSYKQKLSNKVSTIVHPHGDCSLKNINFFSLSHLIDPQNLIKSFHNKRCSNYELVKRWNTLSYSLWNKLILIKEYIYSNEYADEAYFTEGFKFLNISLDYLFSINFMKNFTETVHERETVGFLIPEYALLFEIMNQSNDIHSLYFVTKQNGCEMNVFLKDDSQERETVTYNSLESISVWDIKCIPKICLTFEADIDNIPVFESHSNRCIFSSPSDLQRSINTSITFIIYGKLPESKLDINNFHSGTETEESYQKIKINNWIIDKSCLVSFSCSNSSNSFGYNTLLDMFFHKQHLNLHQVSYFISFYK